MNPVDPELQWRRYALPLSQPLPLAKGTLTQREGVLLKSASGNWGEAAPLPGFSTETVDEVLLALEERREIADCPPSLRFALEQVASPVAALEAPLPVNALWLPQTEPMSELLQRLEAWKEPVVKVKIAPERLSQDLDALGTLQRARPDLLLRLDPNRRLTLEQTLRVAGAISCDYLEEPLADPRDYAALWAREPVPVALDESLLCTATRAALLDREEVVALVLKPTLLGATSDWGWAQESGKRLVISSCFESGLGLWQLARLAEALCPGIAVGLDTGAWFAADTVEPRPLPESGQLPPATWGLTEETMRLFG